LRDLDVDIELLPRSLCEQRFPQFNLQPYNVFTYNRDGGILQASQALHALKDLVLELGGVIRENALAIDIHHDQQAHPLRLTLSTEETCYADQLVIAAGPWVHHLLGELKLPVRLTRQHVLFFSGLPVEVFSRNAFPSFIAGDLYGFPIHGSGSATSLKAASHQYGRPTDPDEAVVIDGETIQQIKWELRALVPALSNATAVHIGSCMYDVSQDSDFILDRYPGDSRIIFATGMSGHAFKFGPLLGEMLASMVQGSDTPVPLDRFQMARFSAHASVA
jgi:glycine/D-amino acid oxidase-like deaminating enzyme